ncbi:32053_t:CDS:2 [Gigaspora margarita]|uniref:32053_t:CDS:1 n=1 Tax=Gigaspora margarita TaxID=4874 RepID=A0ABN7U838_GIGMA|nr:32053_t:CDS:2 [Gigaspora margarita]
MPPMKVSSDRSARNKKRREHWATQTAEQREERNKKLREQRKLQTLEERFNKRFERRKMDKNSHRNLRCFDKRHVIGDMAYSCNYCGAKFWLEEKSSGNKSHPIFTTCCNKGSVVLPSVPPPPNILMQLLTSSMPECVYNFRIHGELYHSIGGLLPSASSMCPHFAQLYIYDTDHEIQNRLNIMPSLNQTIVEKLTRMLNSTNPYISIFKQAHDIYISNPTLPLKLLIKANGSKDAHAINNTDRNFNHIQKAEILQGPYANTRVLLPRISFSPNNNELPFTFVRRQFPVIPAFAMTINKSQGQTLESVGIYLREPVFSHGQLYVALSRDQLRTQLT